MFGLAENIQGYISDAAADVPTHVLISGSKLNRTIQF